ncbi:histidinol-phosphate transaminase [Saitoella coloradoensis]
MSAFNLQTAARPNILSLHPYVCARDIYPATAGTILLDANENAHGPSIPGAATPSVVANGDSSNGVISSAEHLAELHRYPDPHQGAVKDLWCNLRNAPNAQTPGYKPLKPENMFLGVGSDEAIDILMRVFCAPGQEKILICPPTYGMYSVSADVNDLGIIRVDLDTTDGKFALRPDAVCEALSADPSIKIVYLCTPGNPTAADLDSDAIKQVLAHPTYNGVVVLDEAYIDFAPEGRSRAHWANEYPNVVVMQTLSKAFGLAGIRLGAAFTSPPIASLMNCMKAPYNISSPTSALAMQALSPEGLAIMRKHVADLNAQRDYLASKGFPSIPGVGRIIGGRDANFLLVEVLDKPGGKPNNEVAVQVYEELAGNRNVVLRFRGKELGCEGCIRVSIGTKEENEILLKKFAEVLKTFQKA